MLHAASIWGNTFKSNIANLRKIQNRCLRISIGAKRNTKIVELHSKLRILTISQEIYQLSNEFYENHLSTLSVLKDTSKLRYKDAQDQIQIT